ncbi:uncharacterized protein RCC_09139 [Ramularia collo-cygni]|uniref:Uncharacterized protein n=1 Tax=Ramularia collo-cygni TaxID=112498 RepID=A0A2D3VCJ1_9PEZI|nr:uncharacterized protein RCC_09139 [Ramularia collo-cygni]CZT23425.1 uncharacterized protein RCC_09139 [Ramularia collo-cygni]
MSLKEAYHLAHTAQCRLNIEASRPDRNLRFVVGHLMHYESLRLRIVKIEHDIHEDRRRKSANIDHTFQHKPSAGQTIQEPSHLQETYLESELDEYEELIDDEDAGDDLSLSRFPSGASRPQPPELDSDDSSDDDYDEDFLIDYSAGSPDHDCLERAVKGKESDLVASMYENVRSCSCHEESDAPAFERMWELPNGDSHSKDRVTRAVGQVSERIPEPQKACTSTTDLVTSIPIAAVA